ncbi:ABC transporter permease/M1 family aminopeptidase [Sphingobacterium paludis]|uniref:ABC-2 type transport system permease protein n=1 Tax=Sphingobacterium paludis TaxID=1476465 RepID=A0A4R7CUN6_9SPHI|nr:M1 family aminopeptidase [Sphingobacterium paludis]TDS07539.1 ABC-2 type transport system permease protein [Sphingobacterium paludis]
MFSSIFLFELKRWIKNPAFYIYAALFFAFALFSMSTSLGVFDQATASTSNPVYANSPQSVSGMLNALSIFVYFVLPTIVGGSIYRDFRYNVHHVLFSYSLDKASYLSAKFLSSLCVTILIVCTTTFGFLAAQFLPNVNPDLLGPNHLWSYLQAYFYFVIPNLILFGAIVFALVTYTRNIYIGFIFIIFLFVLDAFLGQLRSNMDNEFLASLIDPFGFEAMRFETKYWTIDEQNFRNIPFQGAIVYNRLIWLGLGIVVLALVYLNFDFSQSGIQLGKAKAGKRVTKNNFGSIMAIDLPQVNLDFSFVAYLKTAWRLSHYDFRYIVRNWIFIIMMIFAVLLVAVMASSSGQLYGTETYPVTWKMLKDTSSIYSFFLTLIIYLFSGLLVQRASLANMHLVVDATAVPNWTLFLSKFIAMIKIACLVQLISMLTGVGYQLAQGYFHVELWHYLYELFVLDFLNYMILILFALFIHSFFKNYYVGFFVCLVIVIAVPLLSKVGIEQSIFKFNEGPSYSFSDMNGYADVRHYIWYKVYWLLFVLFLSGITLLFWRRGIIADVKDRLRTAKSRLTSTVYIPSVFALTVFLVLGFAIYRQTNVLERYVSVKEHEQEQVDYEKKYKMYDGRPQPRIVDVKVNMDIYPTERNFLAKINYVLKNKTGTAIDSIFINYNDLMDSIHIAGAKRVRKDSLAGFDIFSLSTPLLPGDSLAMFAQVKNKPNNFLYDRSPILSNGTFINNSYFPNIGYQEGVELVDNDVRKKYGLPNRDRMAEPNDTQARQNTYIANDSDWIRFEATVSTDLDQTAIAPGILEKEWQDKGRRYFRYKMDQKMLNFYSFISARYTLKKERWQNINLEIYYHDGHTYNLDRMMASMKKSLDYYGRSFSPYQFNQMRIIEFPVTHGTFAQAFANTVPFSEGIGFIAKVDDENPDAVDYPYNVISHELAHQWWAHQVIGANVKGSTMLSESMAEYSSLKVLEKTYGHTQMRKFLKESLDSYLRGRGNEQLKENPLTRNENQQYIHYNKGAVVMYAMSDFLGEATFNNFLKEYVARVAFQEAPYTNSLEFVALLKQHTPDSLQYLIKDMYETITLYDNDVQEASYKKLANGKYQVDITFKVQKYRTNEKGKRTYTDEQGKGLKEKIAGKDQSSLPLQDYVDIGVLGKRKKQGSHEVDHELYLAKHKVSRVNNKVSIIVSEQPTEVGVDPYNKLIDTNSDDNRKSL